MRVAPHCSQVWAKIRRSSSDRFQAYCFISSSMGAVTSQVRGMPPQVATRGFFPSRGTVTCNPLYFFPSTSTSALYFLYTLLTDILYLLANVFVSRVASRRGGIAAPFSTGPLQTGR